MEEMNMFGPFELPNIKFSVLSDIGGHIIIELPPLWKGDNPTSDDMTWYQMTLERRVSNDVFSNLFTMYKNRGKIPHLSIPQNTQKKNQFFIQEQVFFWRSLLNIGED